MTPALRPLPHPLLLRLFPFLRWWPNVSKRTMNADAMAGLVSAIVVIPQGVAFATLAGMPPEYGLYLAMVPAVIGALYGSSWHAVTGPTTAISIFVFATLSTLAAPASPHYIKLALTLSFMSGVLMLVMGMLRLGSLVNFISHTVVVGFTAGAGVLIAVSQLRNFFGIDIPRGLQFFEVLWFFVSHVQHIKAPVLIVALFTLLAGAFARHYVPRIPFMIVALLAGSLLGVLINFFVGEARSGITMIGKPPGAVPPLSHPELSFETFQKLAGIAVAVTVLSLTEAISIARALALRSGQRIDGNQEFIGQGLANIAASFFSGYPSSASFNRSGLNYDAGARTPVAAVLSAVFLVLILFALGPLISYIPLAVMAGILFLVAWGLFDLLSIRTILRASRGETMVLLMTFVATLTMNLEVAILTGIVLSLVVFLNRTAQPELRGLVPNPRHPDRKMTEVKMGLLECPQMKILRIEGPLYFGATNHVQSHLDLLRETSPNQKHLLLMAKSIDFIDIAGADLLARESVQRTKEGGALYLKNPRQHVLEGLERTAALAVIGKDRVFATNHEAIETIVGKLDRKICAHCKTRIFVECSSLPSAGT